VACLRPGCDRVVDDQGISGMKTRSSLWFERSRMLQRLNQICHFETWSRETVHPTASVAA
jgi:hypothetical protein